MSVILLIVVALGVVVTEDANGDIDYANERRAESRDQMQWASLQLIYGAVRAPPPADLTALREAAMDSTRSGDADALDQSVRILKSYLDPVAYESLTREIVTATDRSIEALRAATEAEQRATERRLLGTLLATLAAAALGAVLGKELPRGALRRVR